MNENFDLIRKDNRLLYEYIRGSIAHGINTPTSDVDTGGVFIAKKDDVLGLGLKYREQVESSTHDDVWYEYKKFLQLLIKGNPTMLESLFVDDEHILFEHELITELKQYRDLFLTKACFGSFCGYAKSQIIKANGQHKLFHLETMEKKTPYDFIYTFKNQGSTKVCDWLKSYGLKQEYCGLVNIPNMHDMYGLYYDWGAHIIAEKCIIDDDLWNWENNASFTNLMCKYFKQRYGKSFTARDAINGVKSGHIKPIGYRGIINMEETSDEIRLSSIASKDDFPLLYISYNKSGYSDYCKKYTQYKQWEKDRNPIRYESNLKKKYDAKNMCECFRLLNCGIEIAKGEGLKVNRRGIDSDFLLDIKNHKYEYEELMPLLEEREKIMKEAMDSSKLPECVDNELINTLLISARNYFS